MRYKTPAALETAVKEAAKKSPLDTNRAIAGFYFHRLLCRVFSDPDSPFVPKGGQSVLARTVDARATRDIDLLAREASAEAAVADCEGSPASASTISSASPSTKRSPSRQTTSTAAG